MNHFGTANLFKQDSLESPAFLEAVNDTFGKNGQVKKVFWTLFVAMAGLVLARVVDPVTAQQVVGMITGILQSICPFYFAR
jgi:hypothetical protein